MLSIQVSVHICRTVNAVFIVEFACPWNRLFIFILSVKLVSLKVQGTRETLRYDELLYKK